jgi:divalent metal cation (Fe/Co/Zn/Cd) transporter
MRDLTRLGAGGAALGWWWADPLVGLAITAAIALVLKDAAREGYRRLLDAVDPAVVDRTESALRAIPGVRDVTVVRKRWIGHQLHAEADIVVEPTCPCWGVGSGRWTSWATNSTATLRVPKTSSVLAMATSITA